MAAQVSWSQRAIADFNEIHATIAADRPAVADEFCDRLHDFAGASGTFPLMGRIVPEFRLESMRELIFPPYRIIYEVNAVQTSVAIVRIWHSKRGKPELLFPG